MFAPYKNISLSFFGQSGQQTDQEKISRYIEKCSTISRAISTFQQWFSVQHELPSGMLGSVQGMLETADQTLHSVRAIIQTSYPAPASVSLNVIHRHFKAMETNVSNLRSALAQQYAYMPITTYLDDYLSPLSEALHIQDTLSTRTISAQALAMNIEQDTLQGKFDGVECTRLQAAVAPQRLSGRQLNRIATEFDTLKAQINRLARRPRRHTPSCFVVYAWPHSSKPYEQWTQPFLIQLVKDLNEMGIHTEIDQNDSTHGRSMPEYRQGIDTKDYVLVVGTESLKHKYLYQFDSTVRKELHMVVNRAASAQRSHNQIIKRYPPVIPLLISGTVNNTFPENFPSYLAITPWATSDETTPRPCSYYQGLKALVTHMYHAKRDPAFITAWSTFERTIQRYGNNWLIQGLSQQNCLDFVRASRQPEQTAAVDASSSDPYSSQAQSPPAHRSLTSQQQTYPRRLQQPPTHAAAYEEAAATQAGLFSSTHQQPSRPELSHQAITRRRHHQRTLRQASPWPANHALAGTMPSANRSQPPSTAIGIAVTGQGAKVTGNNVSNISGSGGSIGIQVKGSAHVISGNTVHGIGSRRS